MLRFEEHVEGVGGGAGEGSAGREVEEGQGRERSDCGDAGWRECGCDRVEAVGGCCGEDYEEGEVRF